jgi:hypothetical protein
MQYWYSASTVHFFPLSELASVFAYEICRKLMKQDPGSQNPSRRIHQGNAKYKIGAPQNGKPESFFS